MMRKSLALLGVTGVLMFAGAFNSYAGWDVKDGKWRFYKEDGTFITNDWKTSSGKWFYLGEDGYIVEGKTMSEDRWRYLAVYDKYGKDYADRIQNAGFWAVMNFTDEESLVLDEVHDSPVIKNDWRFVDGSWYYFDNEGFNTVNQWQREDDGKWYYLGGDGKMLVNTTTPDGYTVDANGCWTVDGVVKIQ